MRVCTLPQGLFHLRFELEDPFFPRATSGDVIDVIGELGELDADLDIFNSVGGNTVPERPAHTSDPLSQAQGGGQANGGQGQGEKAAAGVPQGACASPAVLADVHLQPNCGGAGGAAVSPSVTIGVSGARAGQTF